MSKLSDDALLARIRGWTISFIIGLMLSGITAIPLQPELYFLVHIFAPAGSSSPLAAWLLDVQGAVDEVSARWPFLGLGTDWLAFGHIVIGLGFIGLLRDPVRNEWLITWGLLACALVIPWAWIFGTVRGIPWGWRLIDCSFGVGGAIPMLLIRAYVQELKRRRPASL